MNVTLYSTNCPKCKILETKLNKKGINYSIVTDVDTMISKGFTQAPVLEVDGEVKEFRAANTWVEEQ